MTKPVAKSLHTITVLRQVASLYAEQGQPPKAAMSAAMGLLGLAGRPDPYGLEAAALRSMEASA